MSSLFSQEKIDKLADKLGVFVSVASEKVKEVTEKTLSKDSPLEKNLKEATSDKNWGCPTSVLSEIARCSFNCTDYMQIMKFLWTALAEPPKKWRRIYKTLTLLEYLLKNGSERVVEETRENQFALRVLQQFSFTEEGRDKGAGIREKAKLVCRLAFDPELLKEERELAQKNRNKFVGIGARGERTGAGFSSFSSSSFSGSASSFSSFSGSNVGNLGSRARAGEVHTAGRPFGASRSAGAAGVSSAKSRDGRQSPTNSLQRGEAEGSSERRASPSGSPQAHSSKGRAEEERKERKKGSSGSKKKEDKEEGEKPRRKHRVNGQLTPGDDLLALDEPPSSTRAEGGTASAAPFPSDSLFGNGRHVLFHAKHQALGPHRTLDFFGSPEESRQSDLHGALWDLCLTVSVGVSPPYLDPNDNWGNFTAAPASTAAPANGAQANTASSNLPFELFPSFPGGNPWSGAPAMGPNGNANSNASSDFFGNFQAAPSQPASAPTGVPAAPVSSIDFFADASPAGPPPPNQGPAVMAQPPTGADKNPFSPPAAASVAPQAPKDGFFSDSRFAMLSMNLTENGTQSRAHPGAAGAAFSLTSPGPSFSVSGPNLNANRTPQPTGSDTAGVPAAMAGPAFSANAGLSNGFPAPQAPAASPFYGQAPSAPFGGPQAAHPTFPLQPTPQAGCSATAFPASSSTPFCGAPAGAGSAAGGAFGAFQTAAPAFGALGGQPSGGVGGAAVLSPFPGSPATTGF
ncbi:KLLA0B04587p, related [Neospora caninum Liverpool]|uniref:KLLA0B04587p, related n=2 Tax=Sarcocystidae TaxID=5809 RepID=F0VKW4_NEOCL|nr:KLLA0B04587p, related [Neospora caninum Liverpool]CBZ54715.1 KLLA0B04587p, related [Neospora caninum Liverpool]|eukprot:XP_003884745.1 KLLA0B04587p, related [Neospora caninum Liverpool]